MKRAILSVLLLLSLLLGVSALRRLPGDSAYLVEEKYDSWTGVLRIWVTESAAIGGVSPMSWLNACAAQMEKAHSGVYCSFRMVPDEALGEPTLYPPDVIVYTDGLLANHDRLAEIGPELPLRAELRQSNYAVPIAISPCFLIYRTSGGLPADLIGTTVACEERRLDALTALCTGLRSENAPAQVLPGLDLGLEGSVVSTPAPIGNVRCRVGSGLILTDAPRKAFLDRTADVFVGDASDLRAMADVSGWAAASPGNMVWADRVLLCSIVDRQDGQRADLCRELIGLLLTDGQKTISRISAFPAVDSVGAWTTGPQASLEAALDGKPCLAPSFFGVWDSLSAARRYIEGTLTADEAAKLLAPRNGT